MTKKTKYLVETSAIPVALRESTPKHCQHFTESVADGVLFVSTYVRMEFIRRWIRDYVKLAALIDHFGNMADALDHVNQEFGIRRVKALNHLVTVVLRQEGEVQNTRAMATEVARIAVAKLRQFDRTFVSRIPNTCGCRIGSRQLRVDFNDLFEDLRAFLRSIDVVHDCPVNDFLKLGKPGAAQKLLQHEKARKTKVGAALSKYHEAATRVTCRECQRIGDAVIALEQPKYCCLAHIDRAFDHLCEATGRQHKLILSQRAVEKDDAKNGL